MTDAYELSSKPPKMLIADDDPAIVKLLAERCASVGFEVETATNGVQALIKANRNHPDIVIIDVNMPEADGLTVCARLLDSSKKSLNVVVVTGSREAKTIERCQGFGAFYVRKGPEFWSGLEAALIETFPRMADSIKDLHGRRRGAEVRERPRVLIIDDDLSIKQFLDSRLDKCGVELLHASDLAQGYRMACREAPSVIVSDYSLANGGVSYLLSRLRTTPATMNVPVLVLTGRNLDQRTKDILMREVCRKPGVSGVLRKSLDLDELFAALQRFCGFEYSRMHG
jgi:CheY-like chemotaxis protein